MAPQQDKTSTEASTAVTLTINDHTYTVGPEVPSGTRLVDFLRHKIQLVGTKTLCREGGCGLCTVVATVPDHETPGRTKTISVQACQALLYSCHGWSISTIEHLGSRYDGYHQLQKALHGFYGTQCGYCSPGMIMTMYGQMSTSGTLTAAQVEKSLDGNICRCTGYRPILDAFKSLAVDGDPALKERLTDIEEAYKDGCHKTGECKGKCGRKQPGGMCTHSSKLATRPALVPVLNGPFLTVDSVRWYHPVTLQGIYNALQTLGKNDKFRLVVGNTGQGVFKNDGPYTAYIATSGVKELYTVNNQSPLELGANVSLTRAIEVFQHLATSDPGYLYLKTLADHWQVVANVSVRNAGCWAGNLMMKHTHPGFQSDIFLTLLAADAELTIGDSSDASITHVNLEQFLKTDMSRKVILSISLPPATANTKLRTFKITPRAVNAHAYVNACFKMELNAGDGFKVLTKPTLLLGGINPQFIHAAKTENFLLNKKVSDVKTLLDAAKIMEREIIPDSHPQDASPEYRKSLAISLFYKTVVGFLGEKVSPRFQSAGPNIVRPLSSGRQSFDMNQETWPVGEPVPKLESAIQISGEAAYLDDIPYHPNELHGAFVHTTVANAKLKSVDTTEAMKVAGVVTFVNASDIPGTNSFVVNAGPFPDPIFVQDRVKYAGQPIGLVVAKDRDTAYHAAKLVIVEYEDVKKPILTIKDALKAGKKHTSMNFITNTREPYTLGNAEEALKTAAHTLTGELSQGSQYHFNMEPHSARVVPTEDGYDVYSTTQWPTETQATTAQVLGIATNSINVSVRRIGGGYGSKISRQHIVSTAAAVAARKVKQPVRVVTDLTTNMTYAGWREPFLSKYEVGFDGNGKIEGAKIELIADTGHVSNESAVSFLFGAVQNAYYIPNLTFTPSMVNTDTAANTYCRTPGHVEAVATIENIMEHIASYLKVDKMQVRLNNMVAPGVPRMFVPPHQKNVVKDEILPLLTTQASIVQRQREVDDFNKNNKWKKRGLSILPMWYGFDYPSMFRYGIQVTIYEHDGTVAISHGGIEMGQGINTKVAQVAAYVLGIPLENIVVKASDTMVGANSMVTGGSFGTDLCAHGVRVACTSLRQRLDVVKEKMKKETGKDPTWLQLVKKCHAEDVDLSQRYWTAGKEHPERYDIWGAAALELEIDVLTGVFVIRRADIIEDSGRSMSPYIDIGQVEGAFIMGIGFYTSEMVKYDPNTGQKLSNGTWEYKPPMALDIPADFRITLLPNAKNPYGVLGSKATGEPPLCLSYAVVTALRQAITAFRQENGDSSWFQMDTPITVEKVHQWCGVNTSQFQLYE